MISKLQQQIEKLITTGKVPGDDINRKISHILTTKAHLHSTQQYYPDQWYQEYCNQTQKKLDVILKRLYTIKDLPLYKTLSNIEVENGH